jgi:hypothetical protein
MNEEGLQRVGARRQAAIFLDAQGHPTEDSTKAVCGEVVDYDARGSRVSRTWFFIEEVEINWLPVSESAFLLWVLGLFLAIWLVIGVILGLA